MKQFNAFFISIVFFFGLAAKAGAQEQWLAVTSPVGNQINLTSIYFTGVNTGYIVGDSGYIFKTANATASWAPQISGIVNKLTSIRFTDANTGYIVGFGGVILKTTNGGNSWVPKTSGTVNNLNAVYFTSASTGYAVGDSGIILKTINGGTNWTAQTSGVTQNLYTIFMVDSNTGYIGGTARFNGSLYITVILKTINSGGTWSMQSVNASDELHSLFATEVNTVHGIGYNAVYFKTTNGGSLWSAGTLSQLNYGSCVYFLNANIGYVSGYGVLKTTNGGTDWNSQSLPYSGDWKSLYFTDVNTGYAVGINGKIIKHVFTPPATPTLTTPTQNAANIPLSTNLAWSVVQYKDTYRAQVSTDSLFSNIVYDDSTLITATTYIENFTNGTVYYWRVNAKNQGGTSAWSSIGKFSTVVNIPAAPILAVPAQNAINVSITTSLSWNASLGATTYRVQLSTDSTFASTVLNDSTLSATSRAVGTLTSNAVYYWRVNAKNSNGTSPYSTIFKFTTVPVIPSVTTLVSPSQNATNISVSTNLTWNSSSGAVTYRLQLTTDSNFSSPLLNDSTLTATTRAVGPLAYNTVYYWRVNAKNTGGTSVYSPVWRFTTATTAIAPGGFESNFAGIENGKTLRFNLSGKSRVLIRLYDSKGSLIAKLLDEVREAGAYSLPLRWNNLKGAYYILDFKAKGFRKTIKIHP